MATPRETRAGPGSSSAPRWPRSQRMASDCSREATPGSEPSWRWPWRSTCAPAPLLISTDAWTIGATVGSRPSRMGTRTAIRRRSFPTIPPSRTSARTGETRHRFTALRTLASEPLAPRRRVRRRGGGSTRRSPRSPLSGPRYWQRCLLAGGLACAFAGWNPLLALHLAGGGHNDAWLAVLVIGRTRLRCLRPPVRRAATALAVLVKWIPLLFLALHLLEARANGRRVGLAGFAIAFAVVIALATWRYDWHWLSAFGPLAANAAEETMLLDPASTPGARLAQARRARTLSWRVLGPYLCGAAAPGSPGRGAAGPRGRDLFSWRPPGSRPGHGLDRPSGGRRGGPGCTRPRVRALCLPCRKPCSPGTDPAEDEHAVLGERASRPVPARRAITPLRAARSGLRSPAAFRHRDPLRVADIREAQRRAVEPRDGRRASS